MKILQKHHNTEILKMKFKNSCTTVQMVSNLNDRTILLIELESDLQSQQISFTSIRNFCRRF